MNGILPLAPIPVEITYKCKRCGHEFKRTTLKQPWPYAFDIVLTSLRKPKCETCKNRKVDVIGKSVIS